MLGHEEIFYTPMGQDRRTFMTLTFCVKSP